MKFKLNNFVNDFEVELKAKKIGYEKYNKKDTLDVVSLLFNWAFETSVKLKRDGFKELASSTF